MTPLCFTNSLPLRVAALRPALRSLASTPLRGPSSLRHRPSTRAQASASTTSPVRPPPPEAEASTTMPLFICANCGTMLPPSAPLSLNEDLPKSCPNCSTPFIRRDGYIDMTPDAAPTPALSARSLLQGLLVQPSKQALFRLPMVSYAYERGWRDNFKAAGFPGIDKELDLFLDFAAPGDTVLDMSCGSGILTRPLAASGQFKRVVAADYSDAMLLETVSRARKDVRVPEFDVVRADVAALPFADNSFDAVHSGAALHCWPNVQDGLAEIYRVLKPGGKFFATTFFRGAYFAFVGSRWVDSPVVKVALRVEDSLPFETPYRFFQKDELEWLYKAAKFDAEVERMKGCAIIRATKGVGS